MPSSLPAVLTPVVLSSNAVIVFTKRYLHNGLDGQFRRLQKKYPDMVGIMVGITASIENYCIACEFTRCGYTR